MKKDNLDDTDMTAEIRAMLSFLQFIENKIIKKRVHNISSLDMQEIDGFSKFMSLYVRK